MTTPESPLPYDTKENSPWYRPPPGITKGVPRARSWTIGGLLINNDEGRDWFKRQFGSELADDHLEDVSVPFHLDKILEKDGMALDTLFAPRRSDAHVCDFLVVTQSIRGYWINDGPDNYEEVLDENLQPKETVHEEKVKEYLLTKLGIKTCGFKSYFQ